MKTLFTLAVVASGLVAGCATTGSGDTTEVGGAGAGSGSAQAQESGGAAGSSAGSAGGATGGTPSGSASGGSSAAAAPAGAGAICHEASAATDCAAGHTCADWGKAGAPDLRCTKACDFWAKTPGCDGADLCLPSNLCVPPAILELSNTYTGACDPSEEGMGCRAYGGKLGGMCFRLPWENWPMCSEFCRPTEGFGSPGSDCASFQKCQPALLDEHGVELQTLGLCV